MVRTSITSALAVLLSAWFAASFSSTAEAGEQPAGQLVASASAFGSVGDRDVLYIHRLEEGSVIELHRETLAQFERIELAWSDARTLWVAYGPRDDRSLELVTFIDGKRTASRTLAAAEWGELAGFSPHLHATAGGEIWLEMCARGTPSPQKGVASICRARGWRRVDIDSTAVAKRPPKKLVVERGGGKRAISGGFSASYEGRELMEMHQDPKPYDGQWTIQRGGKEIGKVPGSVLRVAPTRR